MFKRYSAEISPTRKIIPLFKEVIRIDGEGDDQKITGSYFAIRDEYSEYKEVIKQLVNIISIDEEIRY